MRRTLNLNDLGMERSSSCLLALFLVGELHGQGTVNFANDSASLGYEALVYDCDGVTPLIGPDFRAQLFAGPDLESLIPVGVEVDFQPAGSGFEGVFGGGVRVIETVPPGDIAIVEVVIIAGPRGYCDPDPCAWAVGRSETFTVVTGGAGRPPSGPANLIGLKSFARFDCVGAIDFSNLPSVIGAEEPVFAADGKTRLEGDAYCVQLWAGPDAERLTDVGPAVHFLTGARAGFFAGGPRFIPNVRPGETAVVEVRVREADCFCPGWPQEVPLLWYACDCGRSAPFTVMTGDTATLPGAAALVGFKSFSLIPALRFVHWDRDDAGLHLFLLAKPNETVLVQRSTDAATWADWRTVLGTGDALEIVDETSSDSERLFYRAVVR
jgi:hypothetical protein